MGYWTILESMCVRVVKADEWLMLKHTQITIILGNYCSEDAYAYHSKMDICIHQHDSPRGIVS